MEFSYISLGNDCSSARALKDLGLRTSAHPFDWTETSFDALEKCIRDDFKHFHKNINLNDTKQRLVDEYGIQYPHDYPQTQSPKYTSTDKNLYAECTISEDYEKYTDQVLEKYGRRIERFRNTMSDKSKPIIAFYRDTYDNAIKIKYLLESTYKRENIIIVVATKKPTTEKGQGHIAIIGCDPEQNNKWNETEIWAKSVERAKQIYQYLSTFQPKVNRFSVRHWNI